MVKTQTDLTNKPSCLFTGGWAFFLCENGRQKPLEGSNGIHKIYPKDSVLYVFTHTVRDFFTVPASIWTEQGSFSNYL